MILDAEQTGTAQCTLLNTRPFLFMLPCVVPGRRNDHPRTDPVIYGRSPRSLIQSDEAIHQNLEFEAELKLRIWLYAQSSYLVWRVTPLPSP